MQKNAPAIANGLSAQIDCAFCDARFEEAGKGIDICFGEGVVLNCEMQLRVIVFVAVPGLSLNYTPPHHFLGIEEWRRA